jgi:uncharacterized membrane protein YgdD (TMEM256/DUF423 family)
METLNALVLIAGGILAVSSLIVAKKPDARKLIDKLVPYKAMIGVALLVLGILNLIRALTNHLLDILRVVPLFGLTCLAMCVTSILLGLLFGMPQIAKWLPGEGAAEQKGMELSRTLAPYQILIGLVGLVAALLMILYRLRIL